MKLYHMSESSIVKIDPDAKNCFELCEPFVQALEYSMDCFYGMVMNAKYTFAVLNKYHLREWSNYVKWATEGVFEFVRKNEFPSCISRMKCVYYYADIPYSKKLYIEDYGDESQEDRQKLRLYEVTVENGNFDKRDMSLYDTAYDIMSEKQDLNAIMELARQYYAGKHSTFPIWEYLSDIPAENLRDITFVLNDN